MPADYSSLEPGRTELRDRLIASEREYLGLEFHDAPPEHPWHSHLGGTPYLLDGVSYPHDATGRPMTFVIQLNFAELPPLAGYPDAGLLQFFVGDDDTFGCEYGHAPDRFHVAYHPHIDTSWEPRTPLPPIDAYCSPFDDADTAARQITATLDRMPVSSRDRRFSGLVGESDFDTGELDDDNDHRIGGYPRFTQYDELREPDKDLLLLQLGEYAIDDGRWVSTVLSWGDGGVAHFSITAADLAARDFSRVQYYWEGG
ncbi:YwqG family protein [Nocardia sp. NPDC050712]|uniref:YwqG family protein n=1 Tax=Nocardia sp. NPDC050712 TaxID=3155518 RepID=UPI00340A9DBC